MSGTPRQFQRRPSRAPLAGVVALWLAGTAGAEVWISELLFNPPGNPDTPNEYIELRGTPNLVLPTGTYLLSVEGNTNGNPGTIRNLFDLSGCAIGGNGFLVLLQKASGYSPGAAATVLANTNGPGWGSGDTSSIGHRGDGGRTELENASITFFLINSPAPPTVGADLDSDDDGVPDGAMFASWTVIDAAGVLDNDGFGDIAYGLINFRRSGSPGNTAVAFGTIVPVGFTASYVARHGHTTGWSTNDWVAGDNLAGSAPNWTLGSAGNTYPSSRAGFALANLGLPNFNAPALAGVILLPSDGRTTVAEGGGSDTYTLGLNTSPGGTVILQVTANPQVQVSVDNGATFGSVRSVGFTNTTSPRTVTVRAVDDALVENSPHAGRITHLVTAGTPSYPLTTLTPAVEVQIADNEFVLLNELKVNPPGTNDAPCEFLELRGTPGASLNNLYVLVLEGNAANNPGTATVVVPLGSVHLGTNGLLLLAGSGHPYSVPPATPVVLAPQLNRSGGGLDNGTISFLLLNSPAPVFEGEDLDSGDTGQLDDLPDGALILDCVAWSDGGAQDVVYGGVVLTQTNGTPDAATRFPGHNLPRARGAWFNGDLVGPGCDALLYSARGGSSNLPPGSALTPGAGNNTAPAITDLLPAICGTIGDPTNPRVTFSVNDAESGVASVTVQARSTNPLVVPDANLRLTADGGGAYTLSIEPVGVGYADIHILAADEAMTNVATLRYAASEMGRPEGRFQIGASDGSTAIPIDDDWMFVGDDENQILRVYPRRTSSLSLAGMDFGPFLDLPDIESGLPREVDVEASTRLGNRLFWMGSHSHAQIGEPRTNRTRIFATDISGAGSNSVLTYVGRYDYLKMDLIYWDVSNAHGKGADYYGLAASDADGVPPKAPDGSGFNIEGLCLAPSPPGAAYVCFRAPIIPATNRNYALVVPVLNFTNLAVSGGPPGSAVFGPPIELELYGRGVRSIEGGPDGYLLVVGPTGDTNDVPPNIPNLYTWTGNPADPPQMRAGSLLSLNPEGIVALPPGPWTASTQVEVISDCGRTVWYGDGVPAKSLTVPNFKKCRTDVITFGPVVKPAPYVISISRDESGVLVTWRSLKNETYRLQACSDLSAPAWSDLPGDVLATGPRASKLVSVNPGPHRFYRVALVNP